MKIEKGDGSPAERTASCSLELKLKKGATMAFPARAEESTCTIKAR